MIYKKGEGLFVKIKKEEKKQFGAKCQENATTMSEEIRNYIQNYIQK